MRLIVISLTIAFVLGTYSAHAETQDEAANKLIVETVKLIRQADGSTNARERARLLTRAEQNLDDVVSKYPGSMFAVLLATGQLIGNLSRNRLHAQAKRARCRVDPAAKCLFDWATEELAASNHILRDTYLVDIVTLRVMAGDIQGARATASLIRSDHRQKEAREVLSNGPPTNSGTDWLLKETSSELVPYDWLMFAGRLTIELKRGELSAAQKIFRKVFADTHQTMYFDILVPMEKAVTLFVEMGRTAELRSLLAEMQNAYVRVIGRSKTAVLLAERGNAKDAEAILREVRSTLERLKAGSLARIALYPVAAWAEQKVGKADLAKEVQQRILESSQVYDGNVGEKTTLAAWSAIWIFRTGHAEAARNLLDKASAMAKALSTGSLDERYSALEHVGHAYYLTDHGKLAEDVYESAITAIKGNTELHPTQILYELSYIIPNIAVFLANIGALEKSKAYFDRSRLEELRFHSVMSDSSHFGRASLAATAGFWKSAVASAEAVKQVDLRTRSLAKIAFLLSLK